MKKIIILFLIFEMIPFFAFAKGGYTSVRPSIRRNGSYVQPHYRTAPNRTRFDNWSMKGNSNPFTGKKGSRNSY